MEVERDVWVDAMTINSESGHTDQLTEKVTPEIIQGYLMFDPVIAEVITKVMGERHHQQNLGYTKQIDAEHFPGYLPIIARFLLNGLAYGRFDGEVRESILIQAIAVLVAEYERAHNAGN